MIIIGVVMLPMSSGLNFLNSRARNAVDAADFQEALVEMIHRPRNRDGYEHGSTEMHARDADSSDYSVNQFLGTDDARDAPDMTASISPEAGMSRQRAMRDDDHFGS